MQPYLVNKRTLRSDGEMTAPTSLISHGRAAGGGGPVSAGGGLASRALRSQFVDLLLGPHGVDRYLELIRPSLTVGEARAEVVEIRRQTARSVTLSLRTNSAWGGFEAGQFVRAGLEIDGVRRTRTYSPAGSQHGPDRRLELTVTEHPE